MTLVPGTRNETQLLLGGEDLQDTKALSQYVCNRDQFGTDGSERDLGEDDESQKTQSEGSEDGDDPKEKQLLEQTQVKLNFFRNYLTWFVKHTVSKPAEPVQSFGSGKTGWAVDESPEKQEEVAPVRRRYQTRG